MVAGPSLTQRPNPATLLRNGHCLFPCRGRGGCPALSLVSSPLLIPPARQGLLGAGHGLTSPWETALSLVPARKGNCLGRVVLSSRWAWQETQPTLPAPLALPSRCAWGPGDASGADWERTGRKTSEWQAARPFRGKQRHCGRVCVTWSATDTTGFRRELGNNPSQPSHPWHLTPEASAARGG